MQESFSITENWDSASGNTAVMWAISHVITNIHEHVKSMERQIKCQTMREKALKTAQDYLNLFFIELCDWIWRVEKWLLSEIKKH